MLRFLFFSFFTLSLVATSISQTKFSSDFDFKINFYSASREEIIFDHRIKGSLKGQYEFQTKVLNHTSLKKDSSNISQFIEAVNQGILNNKIKAYYKSYNSSIFKEVEPEYFFYRHDTEFVEDENGDIIPIAISDTIDYSMIKRIDCLQEWYYNIKKNQFEVQTIAFSPVAAIFSNDNKDFHGWMRRYTRKQGNVFSMEKSKNIVHKPNTVWGQRINLSIPLNDFEIKRSIHRESEPIKSILEPHLSRILFNQILTNKLKAYIPKTNIEYTPPRLDSLMKSRVDTEYIEHEYGDVEVIEVVNPYTTSDLGALKVKQRIYFNQKSLKIEAKIESVILTIIILDDNGKYIKNTDLFEVRFE